MAGAVALNQLLAAIHHEPFRDDLRLAYAAALTEKGDPRGEFITLQCQRHASGTRRRSAREKQLFDANRTSWLGPLRTAIAGNGAEFERGFAAAVEIDSDSNLDEMSTEWSTVERLHFRNTGSRFPNVLAQPCLRALRTVTGAHATHVAALATVEHTLPVVELSFGETFNVVCRHDQIVGALKALNEGRAMPELHTLGLFLGTGTLDYLRQYLRSSGAQRLRHLIVAGSSPQWAELTGVVQELAPRLDSLEIRWEPHHRAADRTHWCAQLTRGQDGRLSRFTLEMMKDATGRMSVYWANNRKRAGLPYDPIDDALVGFNKFSPGTLTAIDIIQPLVRDRTATSQRRVGRRTELMGLRKIESCAQLSVQGARPLNLPNRPGPPRGRFHRSPLGLIDLHWREQARCRKSEVRNVLGSDPSGVESFDGLLGR